MSNPLDEPYLILHKVRGAPAFDVARMMLVPGYTEPWWIIPTSGHRAYPYLVWRLDDLVNEDPNVALANPFEVTNWILPKDLPDHYSASTSTRRTKRASKVEALAALGVTDEEIDEALRALGLDGDSTC